MRVTLLDEEKRPLPGPWLVRIPGWTRQRYLAEAPESQFCEFERGEILMHSPVAVRHQQIVRFLTYLLLHYCRTHRGGEVLNGPAVLQVSEDTCREPDIFVIPPERVAGMGDLPVVAVPSLIVEVVSPGTRNLDLRIKSAEYRATGAAEYWAVDYERRELTAHWPARVPTSGTLESSALSGFRIQAEWLWTDPLPSEIECAGA
ncbi:MAG: Uma2 family endonuclease [Planctomycetes bacterium]|nr:Uma2 family endonuclease [Planctomycetota bacterium]